MEGEFLRVSGSWFRVWRLRFGGEGFGCTWRVVRRRGGRGADLHEEERRADACGLQEGGEGVDAGFPLVERGAGGGAEVLVDEGEGGGEAEQLR